MPACHTMQTQRLELRPLCEDDIPFLFAIQGNREAMRYTYAAESLEECARRLRAYEDSRVLHGFAPWVVIERNTSMAIGWGGLNVDPFDPGWGIEVSYFFHPMVWGRGYATELVLASLRCAFDIFGIPVLSAFAMPANIGSVRVLEKCGFQLLRYEPSLGRNHYQVPRALFSGTNNGFESDALKTTRASG